MKNDTIFQFVCFITNLDFEAFAPRWEHYAKRFMRKNVETTLQQQSETKGRFKYISQHEWPQEDFQFAFMEERKGSEHFPEHNVKVVQAGGYTPVQIECRHNETAGDVKIMAFISHRENDIDFYRQLSLYRYLNIYQAYYESCSYAYILEFFVEETNVADMMQQLKARAGIEIARYKECLVPHA
jgi:hypothetical protein